MFLHKTKKQKKIYNGLVTITAPDSMISEQFRTLRSNIQFAMVDRELKSLVITSEVPDVGKTTVSANLAVIFANQGFNVLVAEADLRRPSIHRIFNTTNDYGMTSLLTNQELSIEECVKETDILGLSVLTCGPVPPNPSELIASNRMIELQKKLTEKYDLVIFDTPPLLGFSDTQILAGRVDGTLFVVRHGVSKKENMFKANEIFNRVDAKILGVVYNQVPIKDQDNSYYYEYYQE